MSRAPPAKRKRRPSEHAVTKQELRENNPAIADTISSRMEPYKKLAIVITSIAGALYVLAQIYSYAGGRWMVSDHTMDRAISNVKTEVNTKIDSTKDEVVRNQNVIKSEITGSLSKLSDTLNTVAKSQTMATMDQVDMQMRLAFTQKQTLQGQLAVVNQALSKNPNDQLALTRKMQLEDFIKQNDTYMQDAQQKMVRLRNVQ